MRIQAIVDTAADGIITIDHEGIVDTFNPAAESLFGYAAQEVIGRNVSMLMPPPYCVEHDRYIARYLETGQPRVIGIGREVVGRRKDGSVFPVEVALAQIDHLRQFAGFIRDVSQRKELEREVLEIAATEQRRIGQELHDGIGQELTGLRFLTNTLEDMLPDKDSPEAQLVAKIGKTIKSTLEHVRAISRGLVTFTVNADGLMAALEGLVSRSSQLFEIACKAPVLVPTDLIASQLYRIAQEAIVNAVKHGHATRVTIDLHQVAGTVQLQIVDNGKGIDNPDYQDRGVGVRIMQYRAGVVGGTLRITRVEPRGTRVCCTLDRGVLHGQ
jgi:two-component system sensor kinase FixL